MVYIIGNRKVFILVYTPVNIMENDKDSGMIRVKLETKTKLESLKVHKNQSFDEVIQELLKDY